ncbi:Verru_Chthon cassette protein B [Terrimicrobium sacchariphilum]|jgi:uncharacterized protein (TIGR02598 family)|uniref:Verru_Chthon cassette protein B n=1 Tax=Terrimicrobium sacchariphilum TaxID=690879 RepID=A0A146GDV9_TERSA|nr:Verru_Chthon cassette protein B [Terrimicrobium sacchariphilum]GAT34688.1 Verru_Chthon cassette protein B [Terrimicrobium sacchariphilum]
MKSPGLMALRQRRRAFSLVEVVIALGIVSFAMMGIVGLIAVGMNTFRASIDTSVQSRIAQKAISDAVLTDFSKLQAYEAYFDESGRPVSAGDEQRVYTMGVTLANLTNSITQSLSPDVAKNVVVTIRNRTRPDEVKTIATVVVKND